MMQSEIIVVLDLDDTLYKEVDYQQSGFKEVCRWIERLYGKSVDFNLLQAVIENNGDPLGFLCTHLDLPLSVKNSFLWIYRVHLPEIFLSDGTLKTIQELEALYKILILTDGRSISQRQKLKALNLDHLRAYISEEYSSEKPNNLRYKVIMDEFPASRYIYVGDNPNKDFLAPNSLNWKTVGLIGDERNIHSQSCDELPEGYHPQHWIRELNELFGLLC